MSADTSGGSAAGPSGGMSTGMLAGSRGVRFRPRDSGPPPAYAELHCLSNFSFLRGASHPEELVTQAAALGYAAVAITDLNSLAGVVRAHLAARAHNIHLVIGALITPADAPPVVLLAPDRAAYGRLARLITVGRRRAIKGACELTFADVAAHADGLIAIVTPREADLGGVAGERLPPIPAYGSYRDLFGDDAYLAAPLLHDLPDPQRLARLGALGDAAGLPLVATNAAYYHVPERRYLQDVLTCIRAGCTVADAGVRLFANAERHLRSREELGRRYGGAVELIERSVTLAARCTFSLDELRYEYPHELVPPGHTAMEYLSALTWRGAGERYGERHGGTKARRHEGEESRRREERDREIEGSRDQERRDGNQAQGVTLESTEPPTPPSPCLRASVLECLPSPPSCLRAFVPTCLPPHVTDLIQRELALIADLHYEHYFLTVWDLVRFARSRGILCQGRGSAANSAVCYCLGVTAVDPARIDVLFERFISRERNEPPDIDVDFEHERREEVFQYIYNKYGRERAAITAEVITYRPRSAVRDVGKALGLSLDRVDRLAKALDWWSRDAVPDDALRAAGLNPQDRTVQMLIRLVRQLLGFPRHLSQHVGGFVITETPLCEIVPLENGAMPDRTFIEWDKDDIDALGILKVDCLALGMLTALHKAMGMLGRYYGGGEATKRRSDEATEGEGEATKRRSDEATERRSDGGGDHQGGCSRVQSTAFSQSYPCNSRYIGCISFTRTKGLSHGRQDVSRSDCVAERNGTGQTGLSNNAGDARYGALRPHRSDAPRSRIDSFEHRRGTRSQATPRLSAVPAYRSGLVDGIADTDRVGTGTSDDIGTTDIARSAGGSGPRPPGSDPQPRKTLPSLTPPSLRRSVASSLPTDLTQFPPEDPAVYDMICAADTIGVFQIESRAQMSMLPRLRPRSFYDLVIEVAIVRPGPIQGGMVHPYLRRRDGIDPVWYPSDAVRGVLEKTLGVPLFQEQAMRLAVVAAGFSPGEADQLRRSMAAWRRSGEMEKFQVRLIRGMLDNGYSRTFAEQIFKQLRGFGEYGFPESHAASFALLVYASAWLKCYHPAAFTAAILNAQPMGFYAPAQLVRDARNHDVAVLPVDVNTSVWDCTLETPENAPHQQNPPEANTLPPPALRLGMRLVRGLSAPKVAGVTAARQAGPITSLRQLARRRDVSRETLLRLAAADAFRSLGLSRRTALWQILALDDTQLPLFDDLDLDEPPTTLPEMPLDETLVHDYDALGLSLNAHPLELVRAALQQIKVITNRELANTRAGRKVAVAGLVTHRQRPGTAKGLVFMTLEDETAQANLIIRPAVWQRYRNVGRSKIALIAEGVVERQGRVLHVQVTRLHDLSARLTPIRTKSRDFH
jgi:error-prone DNA polymerase